MKRPKEITKQFLMELEKHLNDLKSGKAETTFEVQDIAALCLNLFHENQQRMASKK